MYELKIVLPECLCLAPKRMGAAWGSVMVKMDCYEQAAIIVAGGQNEDKSISRYGFISNPIYLKNVFTDDLLEYYLARLSCTSLMMTYGPGDPNCLENMLMEDSPTTEKEVLFWEEASTPMKRCTVI